MSFWKTRVFNIGLALTLGWPALTLAQQQSPQQQRPQYFNSPGAKKLAAPQVIAPDSQELYEPMGKIRLAWTPVPGAAKYLLRIWDKSKLDKARAEGKELKPRWETTVTEPWIVLHDVPYASYMYLDQALYVWEVAAIEKGSNELGILTQSSFEVSRQYYLSKRELFLRFEYGYSPTVSYKQSNADRNTTFSKSSSSHQLRFDIEGWFTRHWGADFYAQTSSFDTGDTRIQINRYSLALLNRTYLSTDAAGTTVNWRLGFSLQDYPQIDPATDIAPVPLVSYPQAWGFMGGFRVSTRFSFPLELQFAANAVLPFRSRGLGQEATVQASFGADANGRAMIHVNNLFAYGIGASLDFMRLQYTRTDTQVQTPSSVSLTSFTANFLTQFHWN